MSLGRQEAFEVFKRDYKDNVLIDENKKGLKSRLVWKSFFFGLILTLNVNQISRCVISFLYRYSEAKKLGEQVNSARSQISQFILNHCFLLPTYYTLLVLFNIDISLNQQCRIYLYLEIETFFFVYYSSSFVILLVDFMLSFLFIYFFHFFIFYVQIYWKQN